MVKINVDLKIGWEGMDWIKLAEDGGMQWVNSVMNFCVP
jgi:hypothetical protein